MHCSVLPLNFELIVAFFLLRRRVRSDSGNRWRHHHRKVGVTPCETSLTHAIFDMTCKMLLRVLSVHPLTLKMSARFVSTCEIRLATPKVSTPSAPDITQSTVNGGGQTPPTSTGNLERAPALVSVQWLYEKLEANTPNLRILDCSWHLPFARRDAKTEYHRGHIPGSSFFDIDECSDKESPYEHTLPKAEIFENYVGKMGINNQSHVVVYDNNANFGMFSAQRVWWTFRVFGHHNVSILNGGLPKWQNSGYWDTDEATKMPIATFKASFNPALVKYFEDVERNLSSKEFQLIDARPVGRFDGSSPEPRPGKFACHHMKRVLYWLYNQTNSSSGFFWMLHVCVCMYVCIRAALTAHKLKRLD